MSYKAVIELLDNVLNPLGFSRKGAVWNRRVGYNVDVIDIQVSRAGDSITVNVGVLDFDVYAKLWGEPPPALVEEPLCTVRTRIGEFISGKDHWWLLNKSETALEIAQTVEMHVLPFVKQMHSRKDMEEWLIAAEVLRKRYPPPILSLAILNHSLGKKDEACALIEEFRSKVKGAWSARLDEVANRLNCMERSG